ncbi:hypothetical protein F5Y16DRAFT_365506 [Xylariaceae sp. FL0255]|nr:hypothetical protein F5Y16DRAFT_365506 [Xylariaceae sp. FL0255]
MTMAAVLLSSFFTYCMRKSVSGAAEIFWLLDSWLFGTRLDVAVSSYKGATVVGLYSDNSKCLRERHGTERRSAD